MLRLAVGEIAELVGEDLRVADLGIYIAMRVPINPIINPRIGNIVTQFHRKSPIDSASLELGRSALLCRYMVGEHNLCLCATISYSLSDKC